MRLHSSSGRSGAALQQFHVCANALQSELGVVPDAATRARYDDLHRGRAAGTPQTRGTTPARAVLVVEDDPMLRALVVSVLSAEGYEVPGADDGADALLSLGRRTFDLVVADIDMPMLDGLQLLQVMSQKAIRTPTILVTEVDDPEVERRALTLGAAD